MTPRRLLLLLLLLPAAALAQVETYTIDHEHSFANWAIRHTVSKTSGTFSDVTGTVRVDRADLANSSVDATIKVLSLNSSHRARDVHVLSAEFLDFLKYPEMRFVSTAVKATGPGAGVIYGKLTLHGTTREIQFPFKVLGFGPDTTPMGAGKVRIGFEGRTTLKRSDYGISWGLGFPGGGPLGDDMEITLLIEGVRPANGK